ncbi:MAG: lipoprotein-releasing system ATP-binding protein LolD [Flavobacteriales bacterium]|jgi:lipoprotein-releasing system ATP-binding protein|nr:lipoprotein-releasing system ATP-binding protein LolD [Flavobacteriales bacterium]|tara:strand:- start:5139 stop:5789 length:651 start_codon:yes stop_codon:yes gene_type:complete
MISAKDIYYSYEKLEVLKGVDLDIKKGEFVSIVGASGAGKTTLLQLLGTLDKIQRGSLVVNGRETKDLSEREVSRFRNQEIGFVFQFHNLLNEFTALENVCLPAYLNGTAKEEAEKKGLELLNLLNISSRAKHKTDELSGGEQQRVAVARALINSPSILLADEPAGNLDSKNADELYQLLLRLNKEMSQTIIVITHNKELAKLAHRTLEIKDGKII